MDSQPIAKKLSNWFIKNARDLPWRKDYQPYQILISEMMLQQTQIKTALPYYQKWMEQLPNIKTLAEADSNQIIGLWQGLGYYARARNLHQLAKELVGQHSGKLPNNFDELIQLKGIGPYSAGAIASIAFNQKVPAIDGNVKRVFARLFAFDKPINQKTSEIFFIQKANQLLGGSEPRILNQALMELGALICTPKNANCASCPVNNECLSYQKNLTHLLPKVKKNKQHKSTLLFLWTQKNSKIMLVNQQKNMWWQGLYSLPYLQFENHLSLNQLVKTITSLNQKLDSIEPIYQSRFGISNHKVHYYLIKTSENWLKKHHKKYTQLKPNYFTFDELKNLAISSQSRKLVKIAQNYF